MDRKSSHSSTIGDRLREERKRLGYSQAQFCQIGDVVELTQRKYESGRNYPDARYLAAIAALGVDVQYVVTGRAGGSTESDEADVLSRYRNASPEVQSIIRAALAAAGQAGASSRTGQITGGEQGQVVFGDAHQTGMTINVGGKKKGAKK